MFDSLKNIQNNQSKRYISFCKNKAKKIIKKKAKKLKYNTTKNKINLIPSDLQNYLIKEM